VCQPLGVLVDRLQLIDPLAWCGAATTTMFRGDEETPLRSEHDIKVIGARDGEHCLCGNTLIYLARALVGRPS